MPIYDSTMTKEDMQHVQDTHLCSVCSAGLSVCWGGFYGHEGWVLKCSRDFKHQEIERKYMPSVFEIAQGVKELNEKAVAKYNNVTSLSQEKAGEMLATFWPRASAEARLKGAMICSMYGLNPLLNHVALMSFKNKSTDKIEWVVALEIKANRILARRSGPYSYLDLTPRAMTKDEQIKVFGEELTDRYCSITIVKDDAGHEANGCGVWRKEDKVYGADKGNTPQNMANIRSERQALDRLFPDTMPHNVEVFDGEFSEVREDTGDGNGTGDGSPDNVHDGEVTQVGGIEKANEPSPDSLWDTEDAAPPVKQETEHVLKNPGELMAYCYGKYGIGPSTVKAELNVDTASQIQNLALAKQTIDHVYGEKRELEE